jgi:hypothetical protein
MLIVDPRRSAVFVARGLWLGANGPRRSVLLADYPSVSVCAEGLITLARRDQYQ